jgi:DNA-directed RNA polymerase I subunit RPA12
MGWPFCPSCRSTLTVDRTGTVACQICPYQSHLSDINEIPESTTYSATRPVPLWAKSDEEQRALLQQSVEEPTKATIQEPCVSCGAPEVAYYTVQLRSVDEGQTVFYECPNCKHNWSINN